MFIFFKSKIATFWDSPTLMTWLSYSTKALSLFGVLPLVLKKLAPEDIVLWYLYSTIIALQFIADFGFRQTFSRIISYAYGGAKDLNGQVDRNEEEIAEPNIILLQKIVSTMMYVYKRLVAIIFIIMAIFGTWAMIKPISAVANINEAWFSWVVIVITSCVYFFSKVYLNFLEGIFKIALVRRIEALTSLGSILSSIIVLIFVPTLMNLVLVNQFWVFVAACRDWYLCKGVESGLFIKISNKLPLDREFFKQVWRPAWRSGISGLMSAGLTNFTGIVYAQVGNTTDVAAYLLALRLITQVREISMAPFYSKIPYMTILWVNNRKEEFVKVVQRGMILSHITFVLGVGLIGFFLSYFLKFIGSEVVFVSSTMWCLLSIAFFAHRFGAMHIQVYLTSNHVISHIADIVAGGIFICTSFFMVKIIGIYAIPIGMILGYMLFYCWFAVYYSYKFLGKGQFWKFERVASFPAIFLLIMYIVISIVKYGFVFL